MINDRLIDAGPVQLAVRDFGGDKPPLLLVHGAGGNLAQMTTLARALRPHHRVVTLDLRGHGRSADGDWTWDNALGDLAAVCTQLEIERPAVVGHSLGGLLAALWGERHPDSPGVINLDGNPPPTRPGQLPGLDPEKATAELTRLHTLFDTFQSAAGRVIPADQLPDLVELQRITARETGADEKVWVEGFRRNLVHSDGETSLRPSAGITAQLHTTMKQLDLGPVYAATTCPQLVVLATRDLPEQEPFGELYAAYRRYQIEQAKAVPQLRWVSLAGASHAMVAEQPAVLAGLVTDFLAANR